MSDSKHCSRSSPLGALVRGCVGSAVGIVAMDLLSYYRYKRGGGERGPIDWELSVGLNDWSNASAPRQAGKRLYEDYFQKELPPRSAALTQDVVHWAYGPFWGALYGIVTGTGRPPRVVSGLLFVSVVWAMGYVMLAPAKIYKSIWEYDAVTLAKDFSAHLVYGVATATSGGDGMPIPTEPIGSVPRPARLIQAMHDLDAGKIAQSDYEAIVDESIRDTIAQFEATGSPVITDGEQAKPSFATYPLHGLPTLAPDGVVIPFADGHTRQLPRVTAGPFRYAIRADVYLQRAQPYAHVPLKQAVISVSALSLLYPQVGIEGYSREQFLDDLVSEAEAEIRECLRRGAHNVQIDFTEARLSVKLDTSKHLLRSFVELNNRVLDRFSADERRRIGVHTCPGGDRDSTHSADVDYAELLPDLFNLHVGRFYIQLASEPDRKRVLSIIREHVRPDQLIYVGVTDPINPVVETPEQVRERILEAAEYLPMNRLGSTDDCGFAPFGDDTSTARETAFQKIQARVSGTQLAAQQLGVG